MQPHILQRLAEKRAVVDDTPSLKDGYDFVRGTRRGGTKPGDGPSTKKNDIERGEDVKGY